MPSKNVKEKTNNSIMGNLVGKTSLHTFLNNEELAVLQMVSKKTKSNVDAYKSTHSYRKRSAKEELTRLYGAGTTTVQDYHARLALRSSLTGAGAKMIFQAHGGGDNFQSGIARRANGSGGAYDINSEQTLAEQNLSDTSFYPRG